MKNSSSAQVAAIYCLIPSTNPVPRLTVAVKFFSSSAVTG